MHFFFTSVPEKALLSKNFPPKTFAINGSSSKLYRTQYLGTQAVTSKTRLPLCKCLAGQGGPQTPDPRPCRLTSPQRSLPSDLDLLRRHRQSPPVGRHPTTRQVGNTPAVHPLSNDTPLEHLIILISLRSQQIGAKAIVPTSRICAKGNHGLPNRPAARKLPCHHPILRPGTLLANTA